MNNLLDKLADSHTTYSREFPGNVKGKSYSGNKNNTSTETNEAINTNLSYKQSCAAELN